MWEYKSGAVDMLATNTEQDTQSNQEAILLVSELKTEQASLAVAPNNASEILANTQTLKTPPVAPITNSIKEKTNSVVIPAENKPAIIVDTHKAEVLVDNKILKTPIIAPIANPIKEKTNPVIIPPENKPAIIADTHKAEVLMDSKTLKTPIIAPPEIKEKVNNNKTKIAALKPPVIETAHCYEVGPFNNDSDYKQWLKQVGDFKKSLRVVSNNKQTPSSYLVYYPVNAGIKLALATQFLRSHGINDFYQLRDGDYKGNLSLGLFKSEANATNLQQQLLAKGIHAQLNPFYKNQAQRYVFIKGSVDIFEKTQQLKKAHSDLTIKNNAKACQ
ncbi:MAG: hypothetical protein WAX77_06595 [Methylococcaceae bacterium]